MPEGKHETAYPTLEITYSFTAGAPARGPTYACGGTPADPDEVDLIDVKLIDGDGLSPTNEQLTDWAIDWLDGEGYDEACQNAREDNEPDWDAERDRRIDDKLTGDW